MFSLMNGPENEAEKNDLKIKELESLMTQQNKEIESFFQEHGMSLEDSFDLLSEENFSEKDWDEIQGQIKNFKENYEQAMTEIANPLHLKKNLAELKQLSENYLKI